VALGVAEAIEVSISLAELVTVPVLDARLQELRHELKADVQMLRGEIQVEMQKLHTELQRVNADLVRWVFLTMLGSVALSAGATTALKLLGN